MRQGTTVYLYELAWILPSIAIPVGMLAALVVTAFGANIHLPGAAGRVDPTKVTETAPFDALGVKEIAPGQYEVRMLAQVWSFTPNEIRVPAGSTVHFWATSRDVVHGLFIPKANVNVMLLPGQVAHVEARFAKPGEYLMICHEYCGIAHHTMAGKVIVTSEGGSAPHPNLPPQAGAGKAGARSAAISDPRGRELAGLEERK
ncbi:MAG: cytochrome c oxidase subunit II [Candidatus Rokubacteria bacterium]|nr:cytochrome c oxidase subunit II [Candidatus Rokubacteria bacterium]